MGKRPKTSEMEHDERSERMFGLLHIQSIFGGAWSSVNMFAPSHLH